MGSMAVTYEETTWRGEAVIEITGYEGEVFSLEIPEQIEGRRVLSIGAHAFENRQDLRQIVIPDGCRTLRQFAFYGCSHLEYLSLPDTCEDYYDGVIRQCPALREIRIRCHGEGHVLMREILRDVESGLRFRLIYADREVCLTFPEYVSEAQEDTYARAIHISFEGAGVAYRECVTRRAIDYAAYDRLLPRLTDYDLHAGMNIALDRLMTPEELAPDACAAYEAFLRERSEAVLGFLIAERDVERIRFVTVREIVTRDAVRSCLQQASTANLAEICAVLMQYVQGQAADNTLSLEDW